MAGLAASWTTPALLAVILVVVSVLPGLGAWPLLLLLVDGVVENRIARRRAAVRG